MKLICAGDLHLRNSSPRFRIDNFIEAQFTKLKYMIKVTENEKGLLLLPGDVFNSPSASHGFVKEIMAIFFELFFKKLHPPFVVYGQHDLLFRNKDNCPLSVLIQSGAVRLANDIPWEIDNDPNIHIYGASFDEPIPIIQNKDKFNIILVHTMVTNDGPQWPGHEGYIDARNFLNRHDFDLVVSGDNHKGFVSSMKRKDEKILVNCGSMMRTKSDQMEHNPFIVIVDKNNNKMHIESLPTTSSEDVFDLAAIEREKTKKDSLQPLVAGLKKDRTLTIDFLSNMKETIKNEGVTREIKALIEGILEKAMEIVEEQKGE